MTKNSSVCNAPGCTNRLRHTKRRMRLYCSNACRWRAWNAAHPREPQAPEEHPARSFYSAALLKLWDELDEADALDPDAEGVE